VKRNWQALAHASNGLYSVQDFERAAYRLVTEQVLYASDRSTRLAYALVEEFLADFAAALEPLGVRLLRNPHHRYVVALPVQADGVAVTLAETLLVLVLRQRYDEAVRQGRLEDNGEALVELPALQEAYPALAGRAMPEVGELRDLARTLKRWGLCRLVESEPDDPQPFHLRARPALVEIVGETWLQRLDQHRRDDADDDADAPEDDDAAA
jgi:hypothetical protein